MSLTADVQRVATHVRATSPVTWATWPGGWPGEVEAALLDAVLGIQARYGQPHNGVRGAIGRWRSLRGGGRLDDLDALATCDGQHLADLNRPGISAALMWG